MVFKPGWIMLFNRYEEGQESFGIPRFWCLLKAFKARQFDFSDKLTLVKNEMMSRQRRNSSP